MSISTTTSEARHEAHDSTAPTDHQRRDEESCQSRRSRDVSSQGREAARLRSLDQIEIFLNKSVDAIESSLLDRDAHWDGAAQSQIKSILRVVNALLADRLSDLRHDVSYVRDDSHKTRPQ